MTTFTVQTVHGIEETFVVSPEGKVDTAAAYRNKPTTEMRNTESADSDAKARMNDSSGPPR